MLFIWDIHLTPRYKDLILGTVEDYIKHYSEEKNIIFLGDFVYHFSYHRPSLLALFDLFLRLIEQWKELYILAGNHDRLGADFVFAEAEKVLKTQHESKLHIITTPEQHTIEGQDFLFLPYLLSRDWYTPKQDQYSSFPDRLLACKDSTNKHEIDSYLLNTYLQDKISQNKELTIVHHYYLANTKLTGIKSQFHYKDKAISPHFLENNNLTLISGHIHHGFSMHNYLCLGSVWSTSPGESNYYQFLWQYNTTTKQRVLQHVATNPYLVIEGDDAIDKQKIKELRTSIQSKTKQDFSSSQFHISFNFVELPLERTTLTIRSDNLSYDTLEESIPRELRQDLHTVQLKQSRITLDDALSELVDNSDDFGSSWSNWKQLLQDYIDKKYGDKSQEYFDILEELEIKL